MSAHALVTGGAGFIGSHLCERLLKAGSRVTCVDNLITGSLANIEGLFGKDGFSFAKQDIANFIYVPGKIDEIYHLASPASPVDYQLYPIETLKVGSLGTRNVLGLAREKKARVLIASTSEVYGDPEEHPQKESYWGHVNPIGPRSMYDESKRFSEALVMAYHRKHGLLTRIVRIFNTYGPRMRANDGRAVPNFICQALAGEDITVYGDGTQTRSFCHVSDLVEGLVLAMERADSDPVNLGNDHENTLMEIAQKIKELTKSSSRIVHRPLPQDDPRVRRPDISRAKSLLGWAPRIGLEEGLRDTIEYFRRIGAKR
ncbi:MAG: SDR family oxidoreductase [Myxococcales bacterium]|nr:SDR family oxidoreductase [Myxococcales bacterium]